MTHLRAAGAKRCLVTLVGAKHTLRFDAPAEGGALFVLAHGAGGSSQDPLLVAVSSELAARGHGTLRFDFVYRELGKKLPDRADKLLATYRAVLAWARARFAPKRLIVGGKSMGGRMASMLAAQGEPLDGLLLLGYPLHPANKPDKLRSAHLGAIEQRALYVQGTRDALCDLDLLRPVLAPMGDRARLLVIDGGDHSLVTPKRGGRSQSDVVRELVLAAEAQLLAPRA